MNADHAAVAAALPAYEIRSELGRGAWGVVLDGQHRQLRREVAIKQLPAAFADDAEVRSRFVAEARLLGSLDHPHIVPVYDFVERDGVCALVMEKLSGGTVWDRFSRDGLDAEDACAIALVTAVALHHAHLRGVMHRDIKPENLLFARDGGLLKVADFGIAKVLSGGQTLATRAGEVLGTPAYMAPEQASAGEITPATDVYAIGVTLFEMLSGRLPFEDTGSPLAALYQRVHEPPRELGELAPQVPASLQGVVMAAIASAAEDRHASAEAFAVALAQAATDSFGRGWLDRAGIRAVLGGRIAAITEREPTGKVTAGPASRVQPRETLRGPPPPPVASPEELVPVSDLPPPPAAGSLNELGRLLSGSEQPDARRLAMEIERAEAGAHELKELSLLKELRSGAIPLSGDDLPAAERLLGADGPTPTARLGLPEHAGEDTIRHAALAEVSRWQRRAEHPLSTRRLVDAARVLVRTGEGILATLPSSDRQPGPS